jgi:response regulator of citrate/malate metabolism
VTDSPIRVLVVDDDFHVAHGHAVAVERLDGFEVVAEAHDLASARRAIAELEPHLVLLDLYLPDGNGLDLVRELNAAPGPAPDVILVTAARDVDSVVAAMRLGAFYYLVKPFSLAALREQLGSYRGWLAESAKEREADQATVDTLFDSRAANVRRPTPGQRQLPPTTARVLDLVRGSATPVSAATVADQLGASRPTAQRHLALLVRRGQVELTIAYGGTGRPEHRFRPTRR